MVAHHSKGDTDNPERKFRPAVSQGSGKPRRLDLLLEVDVGFAGGAFYAPRYESFVQRLGAKRKVKGEAVDDKSSRTAIYDGLVCNRVVSGEW